MIILQIYILGVFVHYVLFFLFLFLNENVKFK